MMYEMGNFVCTFYKAQTNYSVAVNGMTVNKAIVYNAFKIS